MTFLEKKVHVDVVELTETEEEYNVLVDFYYAHKEATKEEYMPPAEEGGAPEVRQITGYEAEGWRYRLHVLKEFVKDKKALEKELKEEYKRKAQFLGYEVEDKIVVQFPKSSE